MADRRLIVAQTDTTGTRRLSTLLMEVGSTARVGRNSPISLGSDPIDLLVSRVALEVHCTEEGWVIERQNLNGVIMHPWGLPAWPARPEERSRDSRLGLRVLGTPGREHWVLLEDDTRLDRPADDRRASNFGTLHTPATQPLTPRQLQTVFGMFPGVLAWPPDPRVPAMQLKQVARSLRVSESAIRERLLAVLDKARQLGLQRGVAPTDPEYVYVLVRAGYLRPELTPSRGAGSDSAEDTVAL